MEKIGTYTEHDMRSLCRLIRILKEKGPNRSILEVSLLGEFPTIDVIHPVEGFSPRQIIENMMEKHLFTIQSIWENPNNLITLKYDIDSKGKVEINNNMSLYTDIQIITFYYYRIWKYDLQTFHSNKPLHEIMKLLIRKYQINTESKVENLDPTIITFQRIIYSFPSITLDMFEQGLDCSSLFIRHSFQDFYKAFPAVMFMPSFISILPKLNYPPIAIFMAITLKLDDLTDKRTPLETIYNRVITSYTSTIFPERLKLELCKKRNIVVKNKNGYNFHSVFQEYRQKAKKIIMMLREESPELNNILSKI